MQTEYETIKALGEELAAKLGFQAEVTVMEDPIEEGALRVSFRVLEDQHFLIGQRGANLSALQHLFRALYRKQGGDASGIAIDINDYVEEKEGLLLQDASDAFFRTEARTPVSLSSSESPDGKRWDWRATKNLYPAENFD